MANVPYRHLMADEKRNSERDYQASVDAAQEQARLDSATGERSPVKYHPAPREGFGSARTWGRTIAGRDYRFAAVLMPDGERRYAADRFEGNDARSAWFACSWKQVGFWTADSSASDEDGA